MVNLLFMAAVGLVYAPLAPLVAIGALIAFVFSLMVVSGIYFCSVWKLTPQYKYQLLYVYITKAESGGRQWNVYVNRLYIGVLLMQLLMVLSKSLSYILTHAPAMALVRDNNWYNLIAAAPPIPILLAFKIYMSKTAEYNFRYYRPSPQEIENQNRKAATEKRIKASDLEKRFLNPALLPDKLFGVMVHKSQESLTRQVLEPYPWFAAKNMRDGVQIKAVREENLEYNPERDGPADERQQEDWETKSIASTAALSKFDFDGASLYGAPGYGAPGYGAPLLQSQSQSSFNPVYNPSTDQLLSDRVRSDTYGAPVGGRRYGGPDMDDGQAPLLDPWGAANMGIPYPPSSFQSRPPMAHRGTSGSGDMGRQSWDMGHPRGQSSAGSARDLYPTRSRGSIGDGLDQYGGTRSRSGSVGNALEGGTRSRSGSAGNLLDHGYNPYGARAPSAEPLVRTTSGGSGQLLDSYGQRGPSPAPPYGGQPPRQPPYGGGRGGYGGGGYGY